MAETPFPVDPQTLLDQQNDASMRVCVESRCLLKQATVALVIGQQEYPLPADVVRVFGIADGKTLIPPITQDLALRLLSGTQAAIAGDLQFYILGPNIGFIPLPTSTNTLTYYYQARPVALTSLDTYEVGGDFAALIDRRANTNLFDDDGQEEWAMSEEQFYQAEVNRLQRAARFEQQKRLRVLGWDSVL